MYRFLFAWLFFVTMFPASLLFADGNVQVTVTNSGDLKVVGENNANQLIVVFPTNILGEVGFLGEGTTTFNGSNTLVVSGVTRNIDINMKSGENRIILTENNQSRFFITGSLRIRSSGSAPAIVILDTVDVLANLSIQTGNGNDAIQIFESSTALGSTKISTKNGTDVIFTAFNLFNGRASINTGGDGDFVSNAEDNFFDRLAIKMGNGDDQIGIFSSFVEELRLNGNGGVDELDDDTMNIFGAQPSLRSVELDDQFPLNGAWINHLMNNSSTFTDLIILYEFLNLGA